MNKVLIKNAWIVTEDSATGIVKNGDILISGDKIAEVGPYINMDEAHIIDGTDMIALPGLVDGHRHNWESLIRSVGVDWNHAQYFTGVKKVMGPAYTPEQTYLANYIGALECLDAGITTLYDWFHNNNSPEYADAAIQGLKDAGIRAVFGYSDDAEGELPVSSKPIDYDDARRVRQTYFSSDNQLLTMSIATRGPQFLEMRHVIDECRLAKELDVPVCIHVGDGFWGRSRPVAGLVELGMLDSTFTCIHCNTLADDEIQMMGEAGVAAVFCPEVEMNMGHGFPAALRLMEAGISPGLGIDVCTSVPGDMFASMRAALMGIRSVVNAKALEANREVSPLPVTAGDILRFATQNGADACKLGQKIGSITVGKQADIILLNTCALNMFPVLDPVRAVAEAATVRNVDTVIVAGKIRKRKGILEGIDMWDISRKAERIRNELFETAKVPLTGEWVPELYEQT